MIHSVKQRSARPEERVALRGDVVALVCLFLGVVAVGFGVWAFLSPRSFYESVAKFEPYNRHFLHDAGAFQIGLGVGLLLGAARRAGAVVALGGYATAQAFHTVSHFVDRDLGGRPSLDIPFLALATAVALFALLRWRNARRSGART